MVKVVLQAKGEVLGGKKENPPKKGAERGGFYAVFKSRGVPPELYKGGFLKGGTSSRGLPQEVFVKGTFWRFFLGVIKKMTTINI
jgi:hypothetical protein